MISIGMGALLFAIWLVILFLGKSIGLSMLLFSIPFSYFFVYILEKNNKIKNSKAKFLLIPILLLSSTYFIYDNSFFNSINFERSGNFQNKTIYEKNYFYDNKGNFTFL